MANISLPFELVKPDSETPVTTTTEIDDKALGKTQAEINASIPTQANIEAIAQSVADKLKPLIFAGL